VAIRACSVPLLLLIVLARGLPMIRSRRILTLVAISGVLDMAANGLYLVAVRGNLLSIVAVVSSLYPVSTVLLAAGVDHERVERSQLVGMVCGVAALVMVSVARA
jgi:drug/metabolite transporter (DMT)-like permease